MGSKEKYFNTYSDCSFYNEEKTLESSLIRLKDSKIADEVILIDDCSTDNSLNIAQSFTNNKDWKL